MIRQMLPIKEVSKLSGIAEKTIREVSEDNGLLIRNGRSYLFDPDDFEKLVSLCRVQPKAQEYTGARTANCGPSSMVESKSASAQAIARKLKSSSRPTSQQKAPATVLQIPIVSK